MAANQKIATCYCCGQILPPKFVLPRVKQRIYDYIAAHPDGVSRRQITNYVYSFELDGGPESDNVVCVHIHYLNKSFLKQHGLVIRNISPRNGHYALQRL